MVRAEEWAPGALAEDEIEIEANESADPDVLARPFIDGNHGLDADPYSLPDPDRSHVRRAGRPTALAAIQSGTEVELNQRHQAVQWCGQIEIRRGHQVGKAVLHDDTHASVSG